MIDNLKCPTCGAEYPWQVPRKSCRYCGTEFTRGTCYVCRTYREDLRHGKCKDCCRIITRKSMKRKRDAADIEYSDWLHKLRAIPRPYKTLTEDEWIAACQHFNGCAVCREDKIDAKMLFVPAHRGGPYTCYNVVPVCEKCATAHRLSIKVKGNPFHRLFNEYSRAKKDYLENIKQYLKERLEEYVKGK